MSRNRFTGRAPIPASVVKKFPNWVLALDEEGIPGQDETTLRPADTQKAIDCDVGVCLTAADVTFADGKKAVALVGADWNWDGTVDAIQEIHLLEPKTRRVVTSVFGGNFKRTDNKDFFAMYGKKLPMTVVSRLKRKEDRKRLHFQVSKTGEVSENADD